MAGDIQKSVAEHDGGRTVGRRDANEPVSFF